MNAPVPEVFKIFGLHRYFMWALAMNDHYEKTGLQLSPSPSFFENEAANVAFMYLSYSYAGLYVVCEGWQELKLSDPEILDLLKSPHLEVLKRFRNGVYHYQADYFDKRLMGAFVGGAGFRQLDNRTGECVRQVFRRMGHEPEQRSYLNTLLPSVRPGKAKHIKAPVFAAYSPGQGRVFRTILPYYRKAVRQPRAGVAEWHTQRT